MSTRIERLQCCPLCGHQALSPAFRPPLVRCGECGLVLRDQPETRDRVAAGFENAYSTRALEQRVQARRGAVYREFFARYQPAPGRSRLLDVGCGTGEFLAQATQAGWDATGIEIAEGGVATARARGLRVRAGSLTSGELPEPSFDVVTLWNVLDFVEDPVAEVGAAADLLTPRGLLVVRVCNLPFHAALYRTSRLLRPWSGLSRLLARQCFPTVVTFSARTLRQALERVGLEKVTIANGRPSAGDPYATLPFGGDGALQIVKSTVSGLARTIALLSRGSVLWGSSLLATAVKPDRPAAPRRDAGAARR